MIKAGDKIWELEYDNKPFDTECKRHIRSYVIKEIKEGIIFVKGTAWEIPIEDIGKDYYFSRRACIQGAIKNNLEGALRCYNDWEEVQALIKEVSKLTTMLKKYDSDI